MNSLHYDSIVTGGGSAGSTAAVAAVLALENGVHDIREGPVSALREILAADGIELDLARHEVFAPQDTRFDDDDPLPSL